MGLHRVHRRTLAEFVLELIAISNQLRGRSHRLQPARAHHRHPRLITALHQGDHHSNGKLKLLGLPTRRRQVARESRSRLHRVIPQR